MLVEICANSFRSAYNAQEAGASRIELCSELAVGGITPSYGLINHVLNNLSIQTHVLIRPRSGDFCYSNDDFEIMKQDIEQCKSLGAQGVVSGILNPDMSVDVNRTMALLNLARPMRFTFHRAFDSVPNPIKALKQLEEIGVSRILTSGQKPSALEGLSMLIKLQNNFKGTIIPAAGINSANITQFNKQYFKEIHFSASIQEKRQSTDFFPLNSSKHFDESHHTFTDQEKIQHMISLLHA